MATGVVVVASAWQIRPFAQSALLLQVWARASPGAMRAVAIAVNPKTSFADGMVGSFSRQFESPEEGIQHFACQVAQRGKRLDFQMISPQLRTAGSEI